MPGPAADLYNVFRTHGVIKVPPTFVKVVVHVNKYHHRVKRETPCKEFIFCYTFIHKLMNQARLKTCAASVVEC